MRILFGRDVEREHLEALLDAVVSGPVGCILQGAAGIGKTAVWRESLAGARRRGYQVLETAPSEPDSVLAFSGLGDLFGRLPEAVLEALPEAQAYALSAALCAGKLPQGSPTGQALPRAILGVLRQLSAAGPVLVAIDDEQWLDPASARVLAFALCRLREEPVIAILARRSELAGALSVELGRGFAGGGLETISLEPLPMSAIKPLLESRLKRSIPRPLLRRIHQIAGGNPLYALAIGVELEARHANDARAGVLPIPRTLSDAIEMQLGHVDSRTSEAMLAIAALSRPTLAMLQAAIPQFALSDLESVERTGVVKISSDGRIGFTHPLLASTHYAKTPAAHRRELHRRLATVIDDQEERAQHMALGAEAPDHEIAEALEIAAGLAARRGATESAAQLLEDSARLTPIDKETARSARIIAAAEHRFNSGEVSRAREMLEDVMPDLDGGPLRAKARVQLANGCADPRVAVDLLEAALADAGEDDRRRVEIESELSVMVCGAGRFSTARAHAASAVAAAERLEDPDLLAPALGDLLLTVVSTGYPMPDEVVARLSESDESASVSTYRQPSTAIGLARYWTGEFELARPLLERAAQRALSRGEEYDRVGLLLTLAQLEAEAGNQQVAERHRQEAADAAGEFDQAVLWMILLDAMHALASGDLTIARAKAVDGIALAERNGRRMQACRLIVTLSAVELTAGRPELAHARLAELRDWLVSSGYGPAVLYQKAFVWSQDVDALLAMGNVEEAEVVSADLRSRATVSGTPGVLALASRCEGLLQAARGDTVAAIDAMDAALAVHANSCVPLERARTLLEKGSIQRRAKRKAAAKRTLEEALASLEPLGDQLLVSRTLDELSRIGLRRAKPSDGLTPAQVRVRELVAAGLTNAEVARRLHMSPRTVESHLSRVYREHGVRSRSQLAAAMAAPAESSHQSSPAADGGVVLSSSTPG